MAYDMARFLHRNQLDKAGKKYFNHPLRVAEKVKSYGELYYVAAILHDCVEDTSITLKDIIYYFGEDVGEIVDCISRRNGEKYMDFVDRCKKNEIAKIIKLADIEDNSDPIRRFGDDKSYASLISELLRP
jgi:(p)ppGpp synthase/HD superfamily hydrolase